MTTTESRHQCVARATADVEAAMDRLAAARPLFHSEADFAYSLAWQLQLVRPDARVRLGAAPAAGRGQPADLRVTMDGLRLALSARYLTRRSVVELDGERYVTDECLPEPRRYDVVRSLARAEHLVATGVVDAGVVAVLANDPGYWEPGRDKGADHAFALTEGRVLTGLLSWSGPFAPPFREGPLAVTGAYPLRWHSYSDLGPGPYRTLSRLLIATG